MNRLISTLRASRPESISTAELSNGGFVSGDIETVDPGRKYCWNGLKRGGDPGRPSWLFQYTLKGHGLFQTGDRVLAVSEGSAFCARIPSASIYYADPSCAEWIFFFLMITEQHVASRLLGHSNLDNSVIKVALRSPAIRSAITLLTHMMRGEAKDKYETEEKLFIWMLELERWADRQRHPAGPKSELLDFVKSYVLSNLQSKIPIDDLARIFGLSRSNFSHHFQKTTGHTPAAYVLTVRLEDAASQLRSGGLSVKEIAAKAGFANSNQLCKCFRRRYHMSPGRYMALYRSQ